MIALVTSSVPPHTASIQLTPELAALCNAFSAADAWGKEHILWTALAQAAKYLAVESRGLRLIRSGGAA